MQNDTAFILSLLPKPEEAEQFLKLLKTGARLSACAANAGLSTREIKYYREQSAAFDELCDEALYEGVSVIEDIGLKHIKNAESGWASAWKTILQQRDPSYADRAKVETNDTVKVIHAVPEALPDSDDNSVEVMS